MSELLSRKLVAATVVTDSKKKKKTLNSRKTLFKSSDLLCKLRDLSVVFNVRATLIHVATSVTVAPIVLQKENSVCDSA